MTSVFALLVVASGPRLVADGAVDDPGDDSSNDGDPEPVEAQGVDGLKPGFHGQPGALPGGLSRWSNGWTDGVIDLSPVRPRSHDRRQQGQSELGPATPEIFEQLSNEPRR